LAFQNYRSAFVTEKRRFESPSRYPLRFDLQGACEETIDVNRSLRRPPKLAADWPKQQIRSHALNAMVTQSKVRKNERRLTGRHDTEHELRISEVGAAGRALAKLHAVGAGNADQVVCKKKTKLICLAGKCCIGACFRRNCRNFWRSYSFAVSTTEGHSLKTVTEADLWQKERILRHVWHSDQISQKTGAIYAPGCRMQV